MLRSRGALCEMVPVTVEVEMLVVVLVVGTKAVTVLVLT